MADRARMAAFAEARAPWMLGIGWESYSVYRLPSWFPCVCLHVPFTRSVGILPDPLSEVSEESALVHGLRRAWQLAGMGPSRYLAMCVFGRGALERDAEDREREYVEWCSEMAGGGPIAVEAYEG